MNTLMHKLAAAGFAVLMMFLIPLAGYSTDEESSGAEQTGQTLERAQSTGSVFQNSAERSKELAPSQKSAGQGTAQQYQGLQENAKQPTEQASKAEEAGKLYGKIAQIEKVSDNKAVVTLEAPSDKPVETLVPAAKGQEKFNVDKETQILGKDGLIKLEDLKIGQNVEIRFKEGWFGARTVLSMSVIK